MRRREFFWAIALLSGGGCATVRTAREVKAKEPVEARELEKLVPDLMAQFNVPGVSIACVQKGQMVWSRGFGLRNSASKTPVDNETLFEAASVSKTVFAYAVLKLCERGIIVLDTPLVRYTRKRFTEGDPRLEKITARQVLSHSAGFADWRSNDGPLIRSEPGTRFEYSGEGYYYLQSVLTELKGKVDRTQCARYEADFEVCATDFDDFMKIHLLRPFGMTFSGYLADEKWERRIAQGHDIAGMPIAKDKPRGSDVARYGAVGGLNVTAEEYAKFLIEVVAPKGQDEFRLGEKMLLEMARPQIALPKDRQIDECNMWGLGWGIQEREGGNLLVHSGGQSGFRSLALASVEKESGLIILTNGDNGGQVIFHPKFLDLAEKVVLGS